MRFVEAGHVQFGILVFFAFVFFLNGFFIAPFLLAGISWVRYASLAAAALICLWSAFELPPKPKYNKR